MFEPTLTIGSISLSTYTTLIALGIFLSMAMVLKGIPAGERLKTLDILIAGFIGAMMLARAFHVILNWNYYAYNTGEILQIGQGGLDWHGAVFGAVLGMGLFSRWRGIAIPAIVNSLTLAIPLMAFMAWWGCWTASCAYGAEVASLADYPSWMVWEGRDVFGIYAPRFHTQAMGMILTSILFCFTGFIIWRNYLVGRRFWIVLSLLGLSMFLLGFLRGDYAVISNSLRLDQYLDAFVIILSWIIMIRYQHP